MSSFDDAGDRLFEPLRTNKMSHRIFGFASTIGDFSIVWHLIGFSRAIGSTVRLQQALALSIALGVESLIVNQGIKRLFRRERPTTNGDDRFDIRTPRTSSFPSGHASSATFACVLLTSFTGFPLAFIWITIGVVVALSRVVVRIHHLSDIVGGIVTGGVLGALALPIVNSFL